RGLTPARTWGRQGHSTTQRSQRATIRYRERLNTSHRKVRARVEHVFARMKAWKILRDCRLKGDGVHTAMLGIARLHNLALAG
ncbi:transposase, partial [Streptomyces sp. NPDC055722]